MTELEQPTQLGQQQSKASVSLTPEDWKNVLASMEVGVKTIGFNAFEIGGRVMREIQEQIATDFKRNPWQPTG